MTHAELIDDLVAANHILAQRRIFDAYGHVSARDPRHPERYWLTRSMPPADVTADDIIEFDLDNRPVRAGENRLFFERVIHGEVYKARPDVMAVCQNVVRRHEVIDQLGMHHRLAALSARSGGSKARTGGAGSLQRSISTRAVAEVGPCPSRDVP